MTNKLVQRTVDEFMADYTPAYNSIMPLFLGNSAAYSLDMSLVKLNSIDVVGDVRSKRFSPKDTEFKQIAVAAGSKNYNKYYFASQYLQSTMQDNEGYERIVAQVLDEHAKQADEVFVTGDGQSDATVKNNGLLYSMDPNYTKNASVLTSTLSAIYQQIVNQVEEANAVDGEKLVLTYGSLMIAQYNSLFSGTNTPFSKTLADGLSGVQIAKLPTSITPAGQNGFLVINRPKTKLHYTTLPKVDDAGIEAKTKTAWTNFIAGSSMLEPQAKGAIIRQPLTFS